jgi:hypothetical protein
MHEFRLSICINAQVLGNWEDVARSGSFGSSSQVNQEAPERIKQRGSGRTKLSQVSPTRSQQQIFLVEVTFTCKTLRQMERACVLVGLKSIGVVSILHERKISYVS